MHRASTGQCASVLTKWTFKRIFFISDYIADHYPTVDETDARTVINHNPLPDITHEEFVGLLGPLLAPENYQYPSPSASPTTTSIPQPPAPSTSPRANHSVPNSSHIRPNLNSPAPFDWIHVEGRSVKTTLSNILGLDGLARERKWRSHCVFSVDVGRKGRQGVEAV